MNESVALLLRFWQAGGILMPVMAAVSFGIWYLSLRLYVPLLFASRRMRNLSPECNATHGKSTPARPAAPADARANAAPAAEAARDISPCAEIEDYRVRQLRSCERHLGILRALVLCSPLLGLLGTVKGMIATFVALGGRGVASMDMLSVGISEALITTQVGLIVAIPGLVSSHASARLIAQIRNVLDRLGAHQAMLHKRPTRNQVPEAST